MRLGSIEKLTKDQLVSLVREKAREVEDLKKKNLSSKTVAEAMAIKPHVRITHKPDIGKTGYKNYHVFPPGTENLEVGERFKLARLPAIAKLLFKLKQMEAQYEEVAKVDPARAEVYERNIIKMRHRYFNAYREVEIEDPEFLKKKENEVFTEAYKIIKKEFDDASSTAPETRPRFIPTLIKK